MGQISVLGELERMVLIAVLRAADPYPVGVRNELKSTAGVSLSRGTIYVTLHRLEERGLVRSALGEPTPERGGKAKRLFTVTPQGRQTLRASMTRLKRLTDGIEHLVGH
jgi:DNA-binding PadR family transcriptional regulator